MAEGTPTLTFEIDFRNQRYQDAEAGFRALGRELDRNLDAIGPLVSSKFRAYLENVAEAQARRHGNPWPAGTTSNSLSKRSGDLINSFKNNITVKGTRLEDIVGEMGAVFYAKIHEFGGTIRAKHAKYLTIPLPAALNSDGTPKKQSARDWDKTFILKSKAGNLLIVQRKGKDLIPLYVLKSEVHIPPRLNLTNTVNASLQRFVDDLADSMVKELFAP